jgi:hypothetical protein
MPGLQLLTKVGNKWPSSHPNYLKGWRDGQVVDIRPGGFYKGKRIKKGFCLIELPLDYWALRGSTDWKSTKGSVLDLKKFLCSVDSNGRYAWEQFYLKDEKRIRPRDWFVDYKYFLNQGWITLADFESIYDKEKDHNSIVFDRDFTTFLFHEDIKTRLPSDYSNQPGSVSTGIYSIGSGLDYDTVTAAEADTAAILTGNLTFEHANEESSISTDVVVDLDTATYLWKLTAASGAEHNGGAYGNGGRITMAAGDSLTFDETTGGDLANVEVSNLALDATGNNNIGIYAIDVGATLFFVNRLLIAGDVNGFGGFRVDDGCENLNLFNSTIYGFSKAAAYGILLNKIASGGIFNLYNNSLAKNYNNINQSKGVLNYTLNTKNILCQGDSEGDDFIDSGAGFGTTAKNISEDTTSPDVSYRSKDLHTNTIFNDYANDDYKLDSAGDATNLAIADDGDDLSGTFTDDIIGQIRSTWYIGASEIVTVGVDIRKQIISAYARMN